MYDREDAVGGRVHVHLERVHAKLDRVLEGDHRVVGTKVIAALVCDRLPPVRRHRLLLIGLRNDEACDAVERRERDENAEYDHDPAPPHGVFSPGVSGDDAFPGLVAAGASARVRSFRSEPRK